MRSGRASRDEFRAGLLADRRGANLVEYILVVGMIAVVAIVGARTLGRSIDGKAKRQAACVEQLGCEGGAPFEPLGRVSAAGGAPSPAAKVATAVAPAQRGVMDRILGAAGTAVTTLLGISPAHAEEMPPLPPAAPAPNGGGAQSLADAASQYGVSVVGGGVSFWLPGGRTLSDDFWTKVTTDTRTNASLRMTASTLEVHFVPGLHVDVPRPLSDVELESVVYDFKTGRVTRVGMRDTQGLFTLGWFSAQGRVRDAVTQMVADVLAGSPVSRPGYDPMRDPKAKQTLADLAAKMSKGTDKPSPVAASEVKGASVDATIRLERPFRTTPATPGGGWLSAEPGTEIRIRVYFAGSVSDLANGQPKIARVEVQSEGIVVHKGDDEVAKLLGVSVLPGESEKQPIEVQVDSIEPLGKVREYAKTEVGLRALTQLFLVMAGGDPNSSAVGLDPTVVDHIARREIADNLRDSVTTLIREHHAAIPGIDLLDVFRTETRQ